MEYIQSTLLNLVQQTAFLNLTFGNMIMIFVAFIFLYLAIKKGFEPLLLVPISFGMLLVNIYPDIMLSIEDSSNGVGGLLHYFYLLDEWSILPSLIFMGVGAMTDFGPLIANPKSFRLSQLAGQEDRGRTVSAADDGDGSSCLVVEAHEDRKEVSSINTELCGRAQKEALGVRNQWSVSLAL